MRTAAVALGLVVCFALLVLGLSVLRHPQYTPDGIVYARFAARDAGYSERDATLKARAFYGSTAMMRVARYRELIELDPSVSFQRSAVFRNRVLYPWVVSLLLPVVGFRALFLVSAISYVAFGVALFWMLVAFGRPWLAALLSIVALALPLSRGLAASDLTDMFAAVWWVLALGTLLRLMRRQSVGLLVVLGVASALLTLTRPTPYLVVLPALVVGVLRRVWWPLAASCGGVVAFLVVAVSTHAYGVMEQLRWVYDHEPAGVNGSFGTWYRASLLSTVRGMVVEALRGVVPVVMVAAAIYGVARTRMRDEMLVLIAAGVACLIAVPFNPVPSAIARVVVFPLVPVFCGIAQCLAAALLFERKAAPVGAAPEAVTS